MEDVFLWDIDWPAWALLEHSVLRPRSEPQMVVCQRTCRHCLRRGCLYIGGVYHLGRPIALPTATANKLLADVDNLQLDTSNCCRRSPSLPYIDLIQFSDKWRTGANIDEVKASGAGD